MASPQCCANPPTLSPAAGEGEVVESFAGIKAYVAGAQDSKAAVVLISDVYGFEAPNLRNIADKVASSGYFVVVPDFLHGDPFVPGDTDRPIQVWLKEHGPDKGFEEAKPVIAALREQGVSVVGAAGYCWGAKVVAELAKANEIQAAVMSHPSFVTVDDIKEVKCPIAILGAETDVMSPPELVKQFEQVLSSSNTGVEATCKLVKNETAPTLGSSHFSALLESPIISMELPCVLSSSSWNLNKMVADHMYDEHAKGEFVPATMKGCHYLVDWPLSRSKLNAPSYAAQLTGYDDQVIDIEKIWLCNSMSLDQELKDTCLSFFLFHLLRRHFFGFAFGESKERAHDFVFKGLLLENEEGDTEYNRVFRVIDMELAFMYDFFFTQSAVKYYASRAATILSLLSVIFLSFTVV